MRMYDLISKKRDGKTLTNEELKFMIDGYVKGEIPDYQMSAMLMAIFLKGMSREETSCLTLLMRDSGDVVDLSAIQGTKVDKHSTGGVGDKTTLIVAPVVAALGVKVAKMSGRGLGHTGGTVDKLESIEGMQTTLDPTTFFQVVNQVGVSVIGQSGNLAPADKKLYALRDVTATIESIPLIASSIMSKKLAAGSDCIVLDVKCGSGAFMKTKESARQLAETMVEIGSDAGKPTMALLTNMDVPLGNNIGNGLEVREAVEILQGKGPEDLAEICVELAGAMAYLAGKGALEDCKNLARQVMSNGEALERLVQMVEAQGGNKQQILHPEQLPVASVEHQVLAEVDGYISFMNTEDCGMAACILGAGRATKEATIDYGAGIVLKKKTGDYVRRGDPLAVFYTSDPTKIPEAEGRFLQRLSISEKEPAWHPILLDRIIP